MFLRVTRCTRSVVSLLPVHVSKQRCVSQRCFSTKTAAVAPPSPETVATPNTQSVRSKCDPYEQNGLPLALEECQRMLSSLDRWQVTSLPASPSAPPVTLNFAPVPSSPPPHPHWGLVVGPTRAHAQSPAKPPRSPYNAPHPHPPPPTLWKPRDVASLVGWCYAGSGGFAPSLKASILWIKSK